MKVQSVDTSNSVNLPSLFPFVIHNHEISEHICSELLHELKQKDNPNVVSETTKKIQSLITSAVIRLCCHQILAKTIWLPETLQFFHHVSCNQFQNHLAGGLTVILCLSDGGNLEVSKDEHVISFHPTVGSLTIFPSDSRYSFKLDIEDQYYVVGWFNIAWRD